MQIIHDPRIAKGNSSSWMTHSSTYCEAEQLHHEGEDQFHSQGKEAQFRDLQVPRARQLSQDNLNVWDSG